MKKRPAQKKHKKEFVGFEALKKNSVCLIGCLLAIGLLAACAGRQVRFERKPTVCEARMSQVPFPCGVSVHEFESAENQGAVDGKMWGYQTTLSIDVLRDFYRVQTELDGWREASAFFTVTGDLLLIYLRPKKIMTIDIRRLAGRLDVRCFSGIMSK